MMSTTMNSFDAYTTPPCTPVRPTAVGLGFQLPTSCCPTSSSTALRSHWSADSEYTGSSPLPPSLPASNVSLSPPLVPLQSFECLSEEDEDLPPPQVAAPSYRYALEHPRVALLPSLPIFPSQEASLYTPPSSPELQPQSQRALGRKRKVSFLDDEVEEKRIRNEDNVKRLKTSPAIKHLGIFTRAAFAEVESSNVKDGEVASRMASMALDGDRLSKSTPCHLVQSRTSSRKVDVTVLVSSLPAFSPYPPTPRSTILPPLTFSSSFPSSSTFSPDSDDEDFEMEIKADVKQRLGLASIGLGIEDINLYPNVGRKEKDMVDRMTVVVHTGTA